MIKYLTLLIFLLSCFGSHDKITELEIQKISIITDSLIPKKPDVFYFPMKPNPSHIDSSFKVVALDSFLNNWYSAQLFALKEPILKDYPQNIETYRFTWLRTLHHPISIRMDKSQKGVFLTVKMCNGAGGYEPGKLILARTIPLTSGNWDTFVSKLNSIQFWNLPTDSDNQEGTDGSEWILEGKVSNKYHFVHFWSPGFSAKGIKFKECCSYLISLANFTESQLPSDEIY